MPVPANAHAALMPNAGAATDRRPELLEGIASPLAVVAAPRIAAAMEAR